MTDTTWHPYSETPQNNGSGNSDLLICYFTPTGLRWFDTVVFFDRGAEWTRCNIPEHQRDLILWAYCPEPGPSDVDRLLPGLTYSRG